MGGVDGNLLERLAKIMSYMRPSVGGKPGKRLKRKEKLHMLGQAAGLPPLAGIGALKASRTNGSVSPKSACQTLQDELPNVVSLFLTGPQADESVCVGSRPQRRLLR